MIGRRKSRLVIYIREYDMFFWYFLREVKNILRELNLEKE